MLLWAPQWLTSIADLERCWQRSRSREERKLAKGETSVGLSTLGGSLVSGNTLSKFTANSNTPSNALSRMSGNFPDPVPRPSAKRDKDSVGRYHDIDAPSHADIALSLADLPIHALHVHSWLVDRK